jgi:hypothetical protein
LENQVNSLKAFRQAAGAISKKDKSEVEKSLNEIKDLKHKITTVSFSVFEMRDRRSLIAFEYVLTLFFIVLSSQSKSLTLSLIMFVLAFNRRHASLY